ncbi:MAG: hypothetical protein ACXAC7_11950 [Candidatus Hodarchaeales archaeon]|jgi:hypothetical protein
MSSKKGKQEKSLISFIHRSPSIQFCIIIFLIILIYFIPNPAPPPLTTANSNWDGTSKMKILLKNDNNQIRSIISSPSIYFIGNPKNTLIIVVGSNKPYFENEVNFFVNFVKEGGKLLLFEDNGYSRNIFEGFGFKLSQYPIVDSINYDKHPSLPVLKSELIDNQTFDVQLNQPVGLIPDLNYLYDLFGNRIILKELLITSNYTFEDYDSNGIYSEDIDSLTGITVLGYHLQIQNGGSLIAIGETQLPINDMIERKNNSQFILKLMNILDEDSHSSTILFDESKKLWIPIGPGLNNNINYFILFIFHSFQFLGIALIILGGIIFIIYRKELESIFREIKYKKTDLVLPYLPTIEEETLISLILEQNTDSDRFKRQYYHLISKANDSDNPHFSRNQPDKKYFD